MLAVTAFLQTLVTLVLSSVGLVFLSVWSVWSLVVGWLVRISHTMVTQSQQWSERLEHKADEHFQDWAASGEFLELHRGGENHRIHAVLLGKASGHLHLAQSGHQVLTLDFLGSGFSEAADPHVPKCNVSFYVDQAMEVIDSLGIMKPFTLCGFSTGAPIAMTIAAENPERVSRLVLFSPSGVPGSPLKVGPFLFDMLQQVVFLAAAYLLPSIRATIQTVFQRWDHLPPSFLEKFRGFDRSIERSQSYLEMISFQMLRTAQFKEYTLSQLQHFPIQGPIDEYVWDRIRNHPKKILLVWGRQDCVNSYGAVNEWRELLPQATVHTLADAGFSLLLDKPMECARALASFINVNGSVTGSVNSNMTNVERSVLR